MIRGVRLVRNCSNRMFESSTIPRGGPKSIFRIFSKFLQIFQIAVTLLKMVLRVVFSIQRQLGR